MYEVYRKQKLCETPCRLIYVTTVSLCVWLYIVRPARRTGEKNGRQWLWYSLKQCVGICLEELRRITNSIIGRSDCGVNKNSNSVSSGWLLLLNWELVKLVHLFGILLLWDNCNYYCLEMNRAFFHQQHYTHPTPTVREIHLKFGYTTAITFKTHSE